MPRLGRRCFFGFIAAALVYIAIEGVSVHLSRANPGAHDIENRAWVATGRSWVDRQMCRWFELCGAQHMLFTSRWTWQEGDDHDPPRPPGFESFWESGNEDPDKWASQEKALREIPDYVFAHAPYVHLFSGEEFWPSDIGEHLAHISPHLNYTLIKGVEDDCNLTSLDQLNAIQDSKHGRFIYLQSDDNVEEHPSWLTSDHNIPSAPSLRLDSGPDDAWPGGHESELDDMRPGQQNVLLNHEEYLKTQDAHSATPSDLVPSLNGRCGGISGFTCKGSGFGQCCSIHGWCGKADLYCDTYCDPLHGICNNLLHPPPETPKMDLRKRGHESPTAQARQTSFGISNAPAILVVVDKGNGTVDAFWFFFYSFNQGQKVLNIRFGNHVGDWEHTLVRFHNGKPESVFISEHDFGSAYTWEAVEKYLPNPDGSDTMLGTLSNATIASVAKRPVTYSAFGSHAMYPTPGLHPYILPFGLLHDQTDRGPLWDPTLNVKSFTYDYHNRTVRSSTLNPRAPTGWFDYAGRWGDKYYPLSDPRQYRLAGQYHYVDGPTGPKFKRLGREEICQKKGVCRVRHWLGGHRPKRVRAVDGGENGGLLGGESGEDAT
ncbi:Vacuolar protein sorting-associated protein 62 [Friedmanniomyces endolithicus]|nr:Vacuolar protein sorting-associated protein 62 [Friedmanniomyces endolithicus]